MENNAPKKSWNKIWKEQGSPGTFAEFVDHYKKLSHNPLDDFKHADGQDTMSVAASPGNLPPIMPTTECNDGTTDITNGIVAPCVNKGGIAPVKTVDTLAKDKTMGACLFYGGVGVAVGVIAVLIYKKVNT